VQVIVLVLRGGSSQKKGRRRRGVPARKKTNMGKAFCDPAPQKEIIAGDRSQKRPLGRRGKQEKARIPWRKKKREA